MIEYLKKYLSDEDLLNAPKVFRTHCYVQHPHVYDIECPLCGGYNITWSEFEAHIWCYDCNKDVLLIHRYAGIFGGPIPIEVSKMMGICFDRTDMKGNITKFEKAGDEEFNKTWVRNSELEEYEQMINKEIDRKIKEEMQNE